MKKFLIGLFSLTALGAAPVIPQDMTLLYSYTTTPEAIAEATAIANAPFPAATTSEAVRRAYSSPPPYFEDKDGNGVISVSAFADRKGNITYVQIPDEQYVRMGGKTEDGNGYAANPTKEQYVSIVEAMAQPVEAAVSINGTSNITQSAIGATSLTLALTTAGTNTYLTAHCADWQGDTVTGVTYNSVAMTQLAKESRNPSPGSLEIYVYGLTAPASGANNIVCTRTGTTNWINLGGVNIDGATQTTSPIDASATDQGAASQTSDSVSLTTVADNTAVLIFGVADNCNIAASTNATEVLNSLGLANSADCTIVMRSTTFPKTPAGAQSYTMTFNNNSGTALIAVSIKEASAEAPVGFIMFE